MPATRTPLPVLFVLLLIPTSVLEAIPQTKIAGERQERFHFIQQDKLSGIAFSGTPWQADQQGYTGTGKQNDLVLTKGIIGEFHLKAILQLRNQEKSAAGVRINSSFFGFEGANAEELFLRGPIFQKSDLGKSKKYFPRGSRISFEIKSAGGSLEFLINQKLVTRAIAPKKIDRLDFVPWRSTMTIEALSVIGQLYELPRPRQKAYSIPTIDLALENQRQILVDREEGQYLGHPTTVLLEDNQTMFCVYPKGHGRGPIVMKKSNDGGLTWSDRLPTPGNWTTSKETPTIHRVVDAKGTRRLILFSGLYPIRMAVSNDDGENWSSLKPIGDFGGIVAMGCLERIGAGKYIALFHDDGRFISAKGNGTRRFHVYQVNSSDGGLTWSRPRSIASHSTAHLCEPGMIRSPDGKELTVLLRENSRRHNSFMIRSRDNGKSWSKPVELPAALTGDRHVAKYAPDGRLLVSFRDTTHVTPTPGDWVAWVGKYSDIVNGKEGQYRIRLMKNHKSKDCAYPGVEVLPDGTFVLTTYGHWTKGQPPYIMSVRLKLSEIDQRAAGLSPPITKQ